MRTTKDIINNIRELYPFDTSLHNLCMELEENLKNIPEVPCKIGDKVFGIIDEDNYGNEKLSIYEMVVKCIAVRNGNTYFIKDDSGFFERIGVTSDGIYLGYDDFGPYAKIGTRYALLNEEDAQKMLKRLKQKEG